MLQSHESCVRAIHKELPALIMTLQQLYEASGDAQAYEVQVLLPEILNTLAIFNCFMQRKTADFSRLKMMLDSVLEQLTSLKLDSAEWCSEVDKTVETLLTIYDIVISSEGVTRQSTASAISSVEEFRTAVALLTSML